MSEMLQYTYRGLQAKFLSDFNENSIFLPTFGNITRISHSMKIRAVGAGLFHGHRQINRQDETHM
jgi:hypothetical protein